MNKTILLAIIGIFSICRVSCGASDPSPRQQITYRCFVIQSETPIPHDVSKLSQRSGIDVISAPAVMGKIDKEVSVNVVKELIPEFVKGKKFCDRIETGILISLNGTPDHGNILLTGKTQVIEVADRRVTQESTCLATVTKTLYFSKIVKNGKDAWFDFNLPHQKPRYLTLRVVPTLAPS